ncbi:DUF3566 domain-containing protein [Mycolicibacterium pulveris]|uniref:DUF3566 domain-containing protein n=1 Tax=Mycolicibacterium pulveris TaxID=36813 RepID=UPI003CF6A902
MSSPNEPGHPRAVDGAGGGNGAAGGPGVSDRGDVPPWQRGQGAARGANAAQRPPEAPPRRRPVAGRGPNTRGDAAEGPGDDGPRTPGHAAATPETRQPGPDTRQPHPEAYGSELPDLSGPTPRPTQRKPPAERPTAEPANRPAGPTSRIQVGTRHHGPVRASMQIRRIDPWSTLKVSLVLSVVLFFVWMIAVAFLYLALGGMGVWSKLNSNVGDLLTTASGTSGGELVSSGTIFGGATLIGLVNIVVLTAMATVGAFVYNLTTDLVGGVEVTLADRD